MLSVNISNVAIVTITNVDNSRIIYNSKSEAIKLLDNSLLEDPGYI